MTTSNHDSELQTLGLEWAAVEHAGNVAALESLLTEDFVGIGPHGFTLSKQQWLARYADGDLVHASFTWDVEVVRDYDAAAVLTGVQEQQSTYRGRAVDGRFRASLFLVAQENRWRIAAIQLSNLMEGA